MRFARRFAPQVRAWLVGLASVLLAIACPAGAQVDAAGARDYVASIRPSAELQHFLDARIDATLAQDPALRRAGLRVALLDSEPWRAAAARRAPRRRRRSIRPAW